MKKITVSAIGSLLAVMTMATIAVAPTFAATITSSVGANISDNRSAIGTEAAASFSAAQAKGDTAIEARVTALNSLQARINEMVKVSAGQKATLTAAIQTALQDMTSLKAKIDADTVAATLKTDIQSITKDNRIYALIIPQGRIEASADREETIVSLMDTLETKLQARITADQGDSNASALQSSNADFQAKVADANTQAQAAVNLVAGLQPDQGNQSILQSNTAALKQAVADIKVGAADLKTARQDVTTIVAGLKADETVKTSTSTSTTANSTAAQ